MTAGRTLYLGLHLLDRQLIDRDGRLVGKVDDLELTEGASGALYVSAILSGHGVLAQRMGSTRLGPWLQRLHRLLEADDGNGDRARIDFGRVADIASSIRLAADQEELGTQRSHEWVDDHIIQHVPGSDHEAE